MGTSFPSAGQNIVELDFWGITLNGFARAPGRTGHRPGSLPDPRWAPLPVGSSPSERPVETSGSTSRDRPPAVLIRRIRGARDEDPIYKLQTTCTNHIYMRLSGLITTQPTPTLTSSSHSHSLTRSVALPASMRLKRPELTVGGMRFPRSP